jgi:hypothetical protein
MKADKLIEAIVTANSTPQMQLDSFLRHINDTDEFIIDLVTIVFRLPKKKRTFREMENELTDLFFKQLGLWGSFLATIYGIHDKSGPVEGIKKSIIKRACRKMGFIDPLA